MNRLLLIVVCGFMLVGCSDEEPTVAPTPPDVEAQLAAGREALAAAQAQAIEARAEAARAAEAEVNPCEVLTEAMIRAHLTLPDGAVITPRRGSGAASTLCTYGWEDPNFDAQAHQRDMVRQIMQRMKNRGGTEGAMEGIIEAAASARSGGEVGYTHGAIAESEADAQRMFESSMRALNEGITQPPNTGTKAPAVTFQMSTVAVEGVGDQAHWSPRMQQLSVRSGARIFHLSVKVASEPAQNLELAKQLVRALLAG